MKKEYRKPKMRALDLCADTVLQSTSNLRFGDKPTEDTAPEEARFLNIVTDENEAW